MSLGGVSAPLHVRWNPIPTAATKCWWTTLRQTKRSFLFLPFVSGFVQCFSAFSESRVFFSLLVFLFYILSFLVFSRLFLGLSTLLYKFHSDLFFSGLSVIFLSFMVFSHFLVLSSDIFFSFLVFSAGLYISLLVFFDISLSCLL